jgi:hypothetical protein
MAKAKGSTLIGVVKYLRREGAAAKKVLPERLHPYLQERISPAAWYPEADWLDLVRAQAKLVKSPGGNVFETIGRWAVREHADGVYNHLLTGNTDPLALPRRLFALWSSQHDTGKFVLHLEGENLARVELAGYAHPSSEMCQLLRGYLSEMLVFAGLRSVTAEKVQCRLAGADVCSWRCGWEQP